MDGKVVVTTSAHQGHAVSGDYFICAKNWHEVTWLGSPQTKFASKSI